MHHRQQHGIEDHCGQESRLGNCQVGRRGKLRHDEGRRTHHRRHQLPSGRGDRLDGSGGFLAIAALAHERNRDRTRGQHVRDGGAGNHAHQARTDHGRLRRSATQAARQPRGEIHQHLPGARLLQEGAQNHHAGDEGGTDAERRPENAAAAEVKLRGHAFQGIASMRQAIGQIGTKQAVGDENRRQDHDRPADRPAARIEQDRHQDDGKDDLEVGDLAPSVIDGVEVHDVMSGHDDTRREDNENPKPLQGE